MAGSAIIGALATLAAQAATPGSVHPPQVEQRLAHLVGDWTVAGAEATYRETCEWHPGRSFIVCNTVDREGSAPNHMVSILGWSAASGNFTYHHYGQDGRSRSETCFAHGAAGLVCLGERREGGKLIQTRSYVEPVAGGLSFRQDRSTDGGPWAEAGRVKYVPRKS